MEDTIGHLRKASLFSGLSTDDIRRVAELLSERSYRRRSSIYRQGELDTAFYIVVSGRLRVWVRDERGQERTLNYLLPGDSFGEHSLLVGERRDVTVEAEEDTLLLRLQKRDFDTLLAQFPHLGEQLNLHKLERLRKVSLFEKLSTADLRRIAALVGQTRYRKGSAICRQDELGTTLYVIESGRVAVWAKDELGEERVVTHLRDGDSFGARTLLTGQPRATTVQALEDTTLFYLNKRDFDRLVREYPSIGETPGTEREVLDLMLTKRFPWQREDEVLVALSYKHIYAFIRRLWLLVLPLLALGAVLGLSIVIDWTGISLYVVSAIIGGIALLLGIWLFLDWRNDYYVVTNKRVVHVEKIILLRETRNEAPLERIQDVSILTPGIVARLLHMSDLSIQTAGATGRIVFKSLGDAAGVRDTIFEQLERINSEARAEEKEAIRRTLELELGQANEEIPRIGEPEETLSPVEPQETRLLGPLRDFFAPIVPKMRLEEDGVVTWRKHWFRLIDKTAGPLLLLFILLQLGLAPLLNLLSPVPGSANCFVVALLFGLLLGSFLLWFRYEDWRNDIYQLTDNRIVDIEKLPLGLREERREASLAMIQDIKYEIPGILANLFDYGNVVIETAAREAVFTFDWVHQPRRVQEEIFARMDAFREQERQQERERRSAELLDWFSTYTDLTGE